MSTKKTTTTQQTVTPTNPQWTTDSIQGLAGQGMDLSKQDPHSFVAGPTELMQQQFGLANQMGAQAPGYFNQAAGLVGDATGPASASHASAQTAFGGIGNYMNPWLSSVTDSTISDMARARDIAQTGNGRSAMLAGQFGGSRQGVADANLNRDFIDRVGSAVGSLNALGYNTALGAADSDANRAQQTSIYNAGADNALQIAQMQAKLQGAGLLGGLGSDALGAQSSAAANQQALAQQQASAPLSVYQNLAAAQGSLPYNLFTGQETNGTQTVKSSNPMGALASIAALASVPLTGGASLGMLGGLGGLGGAASGLAGAAGLGGLVTPSLASGLSALGGSAGILRGLGG